MSFFSALKTANIHASSSYPTPSFPVGETDDFPAFSDGTRNATLRPGCSGSCRCIRSHICGAKGNERPGKRSVSPVCGTFKALEVALNTVDVCCGAVDDSRILFGRPSADRKGVRRFPGDMMCPYQFVMTARPESSATTQSFATVLALCRNVYCARQTSPRLLRQTSTYSISFRECSWISSSSFLTLILVCFSSDAIWSCPWHSRWNCWRYLFARLSASDTSGILAISERES